MRSAMRRHHGDLQTAVWHLRHPSGKTAVLVGTIHVAHDDYFRDLADTVQALQDRLAAEVHYELITRSDAPRTPDEDDLLARLHTVRMTRMLADLLGFASQHAMPLRPDWTNTDLTDLELLREFGTERFTRFVTGLERIATEIEGDGSPEHAQAVHLVLGRWLRFVITRPALMRAGGWVATLRGGHRRVILERRNRIAYDHIVATPADTVSIWGAGHLPGIARLLHGAGYRLDRSEWVTAIRRDGRHAAARKRRQP